MNTLTKNKLFNTVILLLLIGNIVTIGLFWWKKQKHAIPTPIGDVASFIINELKLDSTQQQTFKILREEHHEKTMQLRDELRQLKDAIFNLLNNENIADSIVKKAVADAAVIEQQLDLITFEHFKKLRAICTPEQKKKFDEIIQQALRMQGRQQPQGPPDRDFRPPPKNGNEKDEPPPFDAPPPLPQQ